ncbi:cysteine desulfurase [Paucihalobacter ruber]|uniref:cysteine desulfurase n=1 Tax=Paucihalobacter ruber TaxID=2567861 RepID=A0A506PG45_9FLAO|nr:cysteine desulfurase family protein [Paucihalobacter ruber]TPV32488.1 cysteine desulfurase [Paucihalobacter ruber]
MQTVYLDNAATTRLRDEVVETMTQVLKNNFGNASSSHSYGRTSKSLIESCRKEIASFFKVSAAEIIFTSGGTEADNLVLLSAVRDLGVEQIISTKIEHHAVLHTIQYLQATYNIEVSYLDLDAHGHIDVAQLEELLQSDKKQLVSLMHINNEIGNILDIKRIANICKVNNALFHSDTVQSIGHYHLDLSDISLDFMAASAHKFHGPKGVGFCFVRKNSGLQPILIGGEQERGLRAGTESIHNIVGMTKALELAYKNLESEKQYIQELKSYFIEQLQDIEGIVFNGDSAAFDKSTYTIINVQFPLTSTKAEMMQFQLDLRGIACSKGSACQSGSNRVSHVLAEIQSAEMLKKPSIRFSFSIFNTKEDIVYTVNAIKELLS